MNYKVNGNIETIQSVGVQALLVAKKFRSAKKNVLAAELAMCIEENLYDLADDFGTNPNWGIGC